MSPYGERPSNTPPDNRLNEEAAEWSLRMSASEPDLDDAPYSGTRARNTAFLEWCSQSSEHLQAFLDMCEIDYRAQRAHLSIDLTANGKGSARTRVNPGIKLALAASIALAALAVPVPDENVQAAPRPYATSIGQRQTVNLEDGSSITLNTQSRVSVLFGPREREVRLLAVEVFFHVARDPDRPFRVFSNGILLEDVDTDFNVYNYQSGPGASSSGIRIAVLNGSLRIFCNCVGEKVASVPDSGSTHPAAPSPFLSEFLVAGQEGEITHVDGADRLRIQRLTKDDLEAVTAWRDGQIILNQMTLAAAVQEFNRYNLQQMTVSPEIAQLVIGGRFDNPDYRSFISALSVQYHIEALPPNSANNPSRALHLIRRPPP